MTDLWLVTISRIRPSAEQAFLAGNLVLLVGAGASASPPASLLPFVALQDGSRSTRTRALTMPSWAPRCSAWPDRGSGRSMIHRIIKTIIATPASEPNEPHRAIARLPAAGSPVRIVTTNYDLHLSSALPRRYATPRPRSNVFVRRRPTRYDKLMPNTRALVAQHQMTLMPAGDETKWLAHGEPIGLSAFETKAFYVIGALREMVESAGLSLKRDYFLAALFMSLDAVELIGRCIRDPASPNRLPGWKTACYTCSLTHRRSQPITSDSVTSSAMVPPPPDCH